MHPDTDEMSTTDFEAYSAALAVLAALASGGATDAYGILKRLERAAVEGGSAVMPFKAGAVYAAIHELNFTGAIAPFTPPRGERPVYGLTPLGRSRLILQSETWRGANRLLRQLRRDAGEG
jgi:DNA-binding PadR family transcriptional regulator